MKIILNSREFDFDTGCRILKLRHEECPKEFEEVIGSFWNEIQPLTFKEICMLKNIEQRRIGILYMGNERLIKEVKPKLISEETISKTTMWVKDNELVEHKFEDTYKLYEVDSSFLNSGGRESKEYFVEFKDTSTDRRYQIWVNYGALRWGGKANAIEAIAWTITTNVEKGNIEKIIRQGDCILVKPKTYSSPQNRYRHLTEEEYRELITAES